MKWMAEREEIVRQLKAKGVKFEHYDFPGPALWLAGQLESWPHTYNGPSTNGSRSRAALRRMPRNTSRTCGPAATAIDVVSLRPRRRTFGTPQRCASQRRAGPRMLSGRYARESRARRSRFSLAEKRRCAPGTPAHLPLVMCMSRSNTLHLDDRLRCFPAGELGHRVLEEAVAAHEDVADHDRRTSRADLTEQRSPQR